MFTETMLDSLTSRLTGIFDRLRGFGRLTEENVLEALREVRLALLEADVNFKVVKGFVDRVREKAIGQDVLKSLTPGQHVVKVVRDELVELLGGSAHRLAMASQPPTIIMLVGLQGSGKTTSAAKLARHFQRQGQHPLLASADVYRPAAIDQLKTLGEQLGIPVVGEPEQKPVRSARRRARKRPARAHAPDPRHRRAPAHRRGDARGAAGHQEGGRPASRAARGRRHDGPGRRRGGGEVQRRGRDRRHHPHQDGRRRARRRRALGETGDGTPIAFVGVGEKTDALEPFHPDRLAQRILGMGDVLSLVEKAQANVDQAQAEALAQKIRNETFSLEDFAAQLKQLRSMGPLGQIMDMVPFFKGQKAMPKELARRGKGAVPLRGDDRLDDAR